MRMRGLVMGLAMMVGVPGLVAQLAGSSIAVGGMLDSAPLVMGEGLKGQPYSLVEKTTRVQTLADGTTITRVTEEHRMRDSEGRTRTERGSIKDGQFVVESITLSDAVEWTDTMLNVRTKTARVTHLPQRREQTAEEKARMADLRAKAQAKAEALRTEHPDAEDRRKQLGLEKLPPENIAGDAVYAYDPGGHGGE